MLSVPVYNETGEQVGSEQLDAVLLGGEVNPSLVKQAVVMWQANQRQGCSVQKSRGQVAGSTRKLYRQKGTGNARPGNIRTPVRRGGGRAFPKVAGRDYRKAMPKKMRRLARNQAVLARIQDERVLIIDGLNFSEPKTKRFAAMLKAVGVEKGCVFATDGVDAMLYRSGRNVPRAEIMNVADLNAYIVLARPKLVFTRAAFDRFREGLTAVGPAQGDQREVNVSDVSE